MNSGDHEVDPTSSPASQLSMRPERFCGLSSELHRGFGLSDVREPLPGALRADRVRRLSATWTRDVTGAAGVVKRCFCWSAVLNTVTVEEVLCSKQISSAVHLSTFNSCFGPLDPLSQTSSWQRTAESHIELMQSFRLLLAEVLELSLCLLSHLRRRQQAIAAGSSTCKTKRVKSWKQVMLWKLGK